MASRVAVVTGGNRGIGFEVVRKLAQVDGLHTIFTARNPEASKGALEAIRKEFPKASVELTQLNLDEDASIEEFAKKIEANHAKLDILVNNAAIAYRTASDTPNPEQAKNTLYTNFFQTIKFTDELMPLLKKAEGARIVNVASQSGSSAFAGLSKELQGKWKKPDMNRKDVFDLVAEFTDAVNADEVESRGWKRNNYGTSKLALIAITEVLAKENPDVMINSMCPGWCATDMGTSAAPRSAEQGADTIVFLTTSPEVKESGAFWHDRKKITF